MQSFTNNTSQSGSVSQLHGTLCVRSESECFFRLNEGNNPVEIVDKEFYEELLDNVPCRIGGALLYDDVASIVGTLEHIGDRLVLVHIAEVIVSRGDRTFQFSRAAG